MTSRVLITTLLILGVSQAHATLALRGKCFDPSKAKAQAVAEKGVEIDFTHMEYLKKNLVNDELSSADIGKAIPTNMGATNDGIAVEKSITRHFTNNLVQSDYIKNLKLFKQASNLANKVESATSLKVKSDEKNKVKKPAKKRSVVDLVKDKKEVSHELDFKVQALKNQARIIYKGFIDSTVTYQKGTENLIFQAHKVLSPSSVISITHKDVPEGSVDSLNYSYTW